MDLFWTRRDVLRTMLAAASAPALVAAATPRPRVGIIGAGMAGVSLAWLVDGDCDVILLEARDDIGGNVRTVDVDLDGHHVVTDLGAQFFHPGPYPLYAALLAGFGLFPPEAADPPPSHAVTASITVMADRAGLPRFVSPVFPDRAWPVLAPWNRPGLEAFGTTFAAAQQREQNGESWALTLEDWLPTLGLSSDQWEGMVLPWAASLFSGSIEQARGLSARAAMIFAAKALPPNPLDPVVYYVLNRGMVEPIRRLLAQCSTVHLLTNAIVQDVWRQLSGGFTIRCADGRIVSVDHLVFASSASTTLHLLQGLIGTSAQRAALSGIEFHDARLALHTDPLYAPVIEAFRSFLNCRPDGPFCEASMWLRSVIPDVPPATAARLWKSWITHRQPQPMQVLHEAEFRHMLPTPATLAAQTTLRRLQGQDGLWFAGGYLHPYDSQETALRSAIRVALGLGVASRRAQRLLESTVMPTA
jgi:predicted NAD/FAD-binding protein